MFHEEKYFLTHALSLPPNRPLKSLWQTYSGVWLSNWYDGVHVVRSCTPLCLFQPKCNEKEAKESCVERGLAETIMIAVLIHTIRAFIACIKGKALCITKFSF